MAVKRVRYLIFLKDVVLLSLTAFGGPQAHLGLFIDQFVIKRGYISEEELLELYALCQILPGPTSTQTITSIGFRIGGPNLAFLTLIIWMLPAVTVMIITGLTIDTLNDNGISLEFAKYIRPIAVGIVAYSSYRIATKVVKTKTAIVLMLIATVVSYLIRTPFALPILLVAGGAVSAFKYKKHPSEQVGPVRIEWSNFILWGGVFIGVIITGFITQSLPIRIFENFYRNGSLIFGGGHVLIPLLFTEFVEYKAYLTSEEFLSGYAIAQALPGPTFAFSSYIGTLSMRSFGMVGGVSGGLLSAAGIFLPGTLFIFFVIRFWDSLKKYRVIKASLEGINAVSAGLILVATVLLAQPLLMTETEDPWFLILNLILMLSSFVVLRFTKLPAPFIILGGLLLGIVLTYF